MIVEMRDNNTFQIFKTTYDKYRAKRGVCLFSFITTGVPNKALFGHPDYRMIEFYQVHV